MQGQQRLAGLDVVRALAIMLVMMAHGVLLASAVVSHQFRTSLLYLGGYFGVELFFALSGLLIVGGLLRRLDKRPTLAWQDIWAFWQRRWWRTLPNYFVFLALNIAVFSIWFDTPTPDIRYIAFWQNLAWPHPPAMPEAWSLAVEEWFYLLLPLLLALGLALLTAPHKAIPVVLAGWIVLGTAARVATTWWADPTWDEGLRKVALLRLDAIAWGGLAACWLHYRPETAHRTAKPLLKLGIASMAVCVAWLLVGATRQFQPVSAYVWLFTLTGASAALCLPMAALWRPVRRGIMPIITWLSRISYSLYLVHFSFALPLMQLPAIIAHIALPLRLLGYFAISLLAAYAAYQLIEKPALSYRERRIPR